MKEEPLYIRNMKKIVEILEEAMNNNRIVGTTELMKEVKVQRPTLDKYLLLMVLFDIIGYYNIGKARIYYLKDKSRLEELFKTIKEKGLDKFLL